MRSTKIVVAAAILILGGILFYGIAVRREKQTATIVAPNPIQQVSLSPEVHVGYWHFYSNSTLKYAKRVRSGGNCGYGPSGNLNGKWQCSVITTNVSQVPMKHSLRLDSQGKPHMTYSSGGILSYASYIGTGGNCGSGSWSCKNIFNNLYTFMPQLAFDTLGNPNIGYVTGVFRLGYAKFVGSGGNCGPNADWRCDTIFTPEPSVTDISFALDTLNQPAMSYYVNNAWDFGYAAYRGSGGNCGPGNSWQCDIIETNSSVGSNSSLLFDQFNRPHVSYQQSQSSNGILKYASYLGTGGNCGPGNSWQCDVIDNQGNTGWNTSLALDGNGAPHISYRRNGVSGGQVTNYIRYASFVGSGGNCGSNNNWQCDTIETLVSANSDSTSLSFDNQGVPHIFYPADAAFHPDVKHAFFVGSNGNCGPNNSWKCEIVDRPATTVGGSQAK